jgi:hypothetical protein
VIFPPPGEFVRPGGFFPRPPPAATLSDEQAAVLWFFASFPSPAVVVGLAFPEPQSGSGFLLPEFPTAPGANLSNSGVQPRTARTIGHSPKTARAGKSFHAR